MHGMTVLFSLRQRFIDDLFENRGVDCRKPGIAFDLGSDRRDMQDIGKIDRLTVDFATADHADLIDAEISRTSARFGKRRFQRLDCNGTLRCKNRVAADDDIGAPRKRPSDRGPGLAPHDHRLAERQRFENA